MRRAGGLQVRWEWGVDVGRSSRGRGAELVVVWCSVGSEEQKGTKAPIKQLNDNHVHIRNSGPARRRKTRKPSVQVIRHLAGDARQYRHEWEWPHVNAGRAIMLSYTPPKGPATGTD